MGQSTVEDASAAAAAAAAPKSKPPILALPPRGSTESFFASGLGFSPGPMTLVSSFFAEQGPFTFTQLLAGAMASPTPDFSTAPEKEEKGSDGFEDGKTSGGGYKRNRPMNLAVTQPPPENLSFSPVFMVPPGLSPSGLLNSPGFLSPLRSPFGMSHRQALAHVTAQAAQSPSYLQMQEEIHRSSLENPPPNETSPHQPKTELSEVSQTDKKVVPVEKPVGDGYNWRKYGQKNVKSSECPRSYYKCTHPNCPVKKKVERSFDGHVSEIVYKGQHNHDPPQPSNNKQGKDSSVHETKDANSETVSLQKTGQEAENNVIVVEDGDEEDEPVAKRRSLEALQSMPVSSHQTITESKIVVQTRSEVDLLDDGYKWRKYGQKVVKGNPHPRSYYRCTYAGCSVRKHVERASTDPKAVITTYEGKHNHEIPSGRYSGGNSSQQLKAQKSYSQSREMDKLPATLLLKEEQVIT